MYLSRRNDRRTRVSGFLLTLKKSLVGGLFHPA